MKDSRIAQSVSCITGEFDSRQRADRLWGPPSLRSSRENAVGPSSAEVKKALNYTSTPPYIFMPE
jgi:hypothetical protein